MRDCAFCPHSVDTDDPDNYVEVSSWVNGPKLDGPKLRIQTGRVAHKDCVDRAVAGQAPADEQPDLFESPPKITVRICDEETDHGACNKPIVGERCEYWRDHINEPSSL